MAKIAFLGVGAMGTPMIRNLLEAGHQVTAWNRTIEKAKALESDGAKVAASAAAAVEGVDIIYTMLIDDKACRAVWTGPEGALAGKPAPGAIAIEGSTVSNAFVLELSKLVAEKGLKFVDLCVAGRPDAAASGQLIAYAGGKPEDVEKVRPVAMAFSKSFFHFGDVGMGNAFKLIYNVMGAIQVVAAAEAMQACEAAGIDLATAQQAFSTGNTNSGHVIRHTRYMATGNHENPVSFSARNRVKDTLYGVEYIERIGGQSRLGHTVAEVFGQAIEAGMGDRNDSELFDALRKIHAKKA